MADIKYLFTSVEFYIYKHESSKQDLHDVYLYTWQTHVNNIDNTKRLNNFHWVKFIMLSSLSRPHSVNFKPQQLQIAIGQTQVIKEC